VLHSQDILTVIFQKTHCTDLLVCIPQFQVGRGGLTGQVSSITTLIAFGFYVVLKDIVLSVFNSLWNTLRF